MIRNKNQSMAFEIKDLEEENSFICSYNPYDQKVRIADINTYDVPILMHVAKDQFPFQCETAYDYFKYLFEKSTNPNRVINEGIVFIQWLNPMTSLPFDSKETNKLENEKTIHVRKKLEEKFDQLIAFLETINANEEVIDIIENNSFFAGGCISSLLLNEEVKDYDLFLTKEKEILTIKDFFEKKSPDNYIVITENAVTLKNGVQIIFRDYGEPEEVIFRFDYLHSMCFYFPFENRLSIKEEALFSIQEKKLKYNSSCPSNISSFYRMAKFLQRGWTITKEEQQKLLLSIKLIEKELIELATDDSYYECDDDESDLRNWEENEDFENLSIFLGGQN